MAIQVKQRSWAEKHPTQAQALQVASVVATVVAAVALIVFSGGIAAYVVAGVMLAGVAVKAVSKQYSLIQDNKEMKKRIARMEIAETQQKNQPFFGGILNKLW